MKRSMHRATAWLLAVIMLLSCMPMNALAAVLKVETSGAAQPFGGARALSVVDPDNDDNYVTFEFYSNSKPETLLETQIVKLDADPVESVIVPATPETPSGKRFEGWKKEDGAPMTFGEVTTANGFSKGTVKVYADFSDVYYVYFLFKETDAPTAGSVFATGEATRDNNYKVVPPTPAEFVVKDAVLTGWVINGTNKAFDAGTVVEADTYVAPVTVPAYWVTFDTDGGSSVPSQYITDGKSVDMTKIANPTKLGYTFAGWYLGEQQITGATYTPTASVVLKAHWTAAPVDYTIVYWGENADDTNYSVLATDAKQKAATGTVLHSSDKNTLPAEMADRGHFTFNSAKDETVTIAADGSSVLNVYFTRKTYTITFSGVLVDAVCQKEEHTHTYDGSYSRWNPWRVTYYYGQCYPEGSGSGNSGTGGATAGNEICGKEAHTHSNSCSKATYTITRKYDSDIADVWNTDPIKSLLGDGVVFQSSVTGEKYSFLQKMPSQDITMTKIQWSGNTYTWYYYLEQLPGKDYTGVPTKSDGGKNYYLYHTTSVKGKNIFLTYAEDYFPITGFTQRDNKVPDFENFKAYLYYVRSDFTLTLNNYGAETPESIPFEKDISGYGGEPARPAGYKNAQFIGWFEVEPSAVKYTPGNLDKTNTEPFDFTNKTMPAKNLVLYAYWWNPTIKVDITIEVATGDKIYTSENLTAGTTIAQTDAYTKAQIYISENNLTLVKWVDGDGVTVDINEPLYTNKSIKPIFSGTTYTLEYDLTEGASGVAPTDGHKYGPDSLARVADSTATKEGGKLVFGYWTDSKGNVYYPGQYITMNDDTTLTANYVPAQDKTQLTYKANWPQGGGGEKTISQLSVNGVVTVLDLTGAGLSAPTNYRFDGWNTAADGTGTAFAPGAQARVDKNGENENVLYAIWKLDVAKYTIHHYLEGTKIEIADDETGSMTIGDELTATAKTTSDTYGTVTVSRYAPTENSVTITANASTNVITVYYKIPLTITAKSAEKVYNGSKQTVADESGKEYAVSGLVNGDTIATDIQVVYGDDNADGKINVGTYDAKLFANGSDLTADKLTIKNKNGDKTIAYYNVKLGNGLLEITPITDEVVVKITGNTDTQVYNGSVQSVEGYTTDIGNKTITVALKEGKKAKASGTDVGKYMMGLTEDDFTATSENYSKIKIEYTDGWIEIKPITDEVVVKITGNTDTQVYTGSEQNVTGYAVTSISNSLYKAEYFTFHGKAGEEAQALAVAKGTNAQDANYMMGMKSEDFENISRNFTNVTFEVTDGWLKINKRPVTITANGNKVGYTGDPHGKKVDDPYTAVGLADGHDVASVEIAFTAVNVGIYEDKLVPANAEIKDAQGNTVTENYAIDYVPGTLTIEGYKIVPEKTTPDDVTSNYKLGDKIPFTITVKNVFDGDVAEVLVQDANAIILAGDGYTVENEHTARIALLKKDAVVYVHAEHEVTSDDILKATVGNRAIVSWEGTERPVDAGTDAIDDLDTTLEVKKTSDKADGAKVKLGEVIKYTITVTNKGNVPYTNVEVVDALTGLRETIDVLGVGESWSSTTTWTVTEADILAGMVLNVATAKADTIPDPKDPENPKKPEGRDKKQDDTDSKNGHLTVTKETTSAPKNGETYALGEKITYKIVVKNDGNLTITEIEVKDTLNGKEETLATGVTLQPEESKEYSFEHIVTEADILAGKVVNEATAKGKSPDSEKPDAPVDPGKTEDDPDETRAVLDIDKKVKGQDADQDGIYRYGETAQYALVISNLGNVTLRNVTATDAVAGVEMREGAGYQLVNGEAVIGELKPSESVTVNVAYPIQRGDIQEKVSTFTNTAQVNGEATVRKDGKTETVRLSDTDSETVQIDRKYQYTVQHYTRSLDGTWQHQVKDDTFNKGIAGDAAQYAENAYTGFEFRPELSENLDAKIPTDDSLIVKLYYTRKTYSYTVEHYLQGYTKGYYELKETEQLQGEYGAKATFAPKDFVGFNFDATMTVNGDAVVPANNELVIKLYYTRRTDLTYRIEYRLDSAKGEELHYPKTVENAMFYQTYLEHPVEIPGYVCEEDTYKMVVTTNPDLNVHVFIYHKVGQDSPQGEGAVSMNVGHCFE